MAYKLAGQNAAVQITDGGLQDGSPTTGGTAIPLMGLLRNAEKTLTANTADAAALGDSVDIIQVLRVGREVTLELFVPDTGAQFETLIGHYVTVGIKDLASLAGYASADGVVTGYTHSYPDGMQTEKLTIRGAANGL